MDQNVIELLDKIRDSIGADYVIDSTNTLKALETATFKTNQRILAIVHPGNVPELQKCLEFANEYKVSVHPISTGRNIGYGSSVPTQDNSILLSLSRLNSILDYNDSLGFVTIEPGVTQGQLYDFLKANGGKFWMDATGGPLNHSIIGNILERGWGHTPYGDHFDNACGMEVVLPSGELIRTGHGQFENAKATSVYRWGIGPYVDGLFTQSNFGIITKLTVWLMPTPSYFQAFYFSSKNYGDLPIIIDTLRPLFLDGTIKSAMHIANDYKVLASFQRYPLKSVKGVTPLPLSELEKLAKAWDFGAWNGAGAIYGSRKEVALARAKIKSALRNSPIKKLRFLDDTDIKIATKFQGVLKKVLRLDVPEMLKILDPVYNLTKGVPSNAFLESVYWRKTHSENQTPLTPEKDGCGLIWISPMAPALGQCADEMWRIINSVFIKYSFEPAVSITMLTGRAMDAIISITYDRDIPGEDDRAMSCHDEVLKDLTVKGYIPYRAGLQTLGKFPVANPSYINFLQALKNAIDPNNILAPGKLGLLNEKSENI
ncbi:FAD-binding protein [Methylomonas sp. UP202]|uniref:FAD-binding oxidoreductase n=1 Tax=Methylomonas sp. UP202 TaxID=3040943 RepID=UPI002479BA2D|nr:FAD-binding protein [Methylomonas sp. UP202]WGS87157.1 FAD-binding protein [Methylomonas sp. UP202]